MSGYGPLELYYGQSMEFDISYLNEDREIIIF